MTSIILLGLFLRVLCQDEIFMFFPFKIKKSNARFMKSALFVEPDTGFIFNPGGQPQIFTGVIICLLD